MCNLIGCASGPFFIFCHFLVPLLFVPLSVFVSVFCLVMTDRRILIRPPAPICPGNPCVHCPRSLGCYLAGSVYWLGFCWNVAGVFGIMTGEVQLWCDHCLMRLDRDELHLTMVVSESSHLLFGATVRKEPSIQTVANRTRNRNPSATAMKSNMMKSENETTLFKQL